MFEGLSNEGYDCGRGGLGFTCHQALTKIMDLEAFDYLQSASVEGRSLGCL